VGFEFSHPAVEGVRLLLERELSEITLPESFAQPARERFFAPSGGMKRASFRAYIDAYIDLFRLRDEVRFEIAHAALLLWDYDEKFAKGAAPPRHESGLPLPLPAESIALLLRETSAPPSPVQLYLDPHVEMSGHRIMSDWFSGQLLDGALVRAVAACDRLATMLWTRAEVPIETTKAGKERRPAFRTPVPRELRDKYAGAPGWDDVVALASDKRFDLTKDLRDDFTHARRLESALHGEQFTVLAQDQELVQGVDGAEHLTIVLDFYNEVLRPATAATGVVLESRALPVPPGGAEKLAAWREFYDEVDGSSE
jgi:hypothetical protein